MQVEKISMVSSIITAPAANAYGFPSGISLKDPNAYDATEKRSISANEMKFLVSRVIF